MEHAGDAREHKRPLGGAERSLGWLTESAVQPKKRKDIEGVSAASLMALKSQVARTQQEAADVKEGRLDLSELRERRGAAGGAAALLLRKNAGVEERDRVDRLEIKTASDRLSESRAALERKAALYDRLAGGAPLDDAEAARYEVDFLLKGAAREERRGEGEGEGRAERARGGGGMYSAVRGGAELYGAVDTSEAAAFTATGGLLSCDMARERERRAWEEEVGANLRGEVDAEAAAELRREMVVEIESETRAGRERAAEARQARQQAEARKRERLKAEFLRRQLEAARAQRRQQPGAKGAPPPASAAQLDK